MLVVYSDYDDAMAILEKCAKRFVAEGTARIPRVLGPPKTTAIDVEHALAEPEKLAVFFFGHGVLGSLSLMAPDRNPAIHARNLHLLAERVVCATACFSWEILRAGVQPHDYTVLGYQGVLNLPLDCKYHPRFVDCALAGPLQLLKGETTAKARELCSRSFEQAAVELVASGSVTDAMIASLVFRKAAVGIRVEGRNRRMDPACFSVNA